MEQIKRAESKEILRTMPGYSYESYASIAARCDNINTHESTDRRLVFELTGHKLNLDGNFQELEIAVENENKDPSN
jgi:hypothetical protein